MKPITRNVLAVLGAVVALTVWFLTTEHAGSIYFPPLTEVLGSVWEYWFTGAGQKHLVSSLANLFAGLGIGIALVVLGGYGFRWPNHYLLPLLGVALISEAARRVREEELADIPFASGTPAIADPAWSAFIGSAKAGLDGFASGLADALAGSGVRLLLVRPGFVVGRMTEGMSPAPFSSTPDQVADAVVAALERGRSTAWVPPVLRPAFVAMRLLPRAVWRRLPR